MQIMSICSFHFINFQTNFENKTLNVVNLKILKNGGGGGDTHVVQLVVESTGVADGLAAAVAAPQSRRRRLTVGTGQTGAPRPRLRLPFDQHKKSKKIKTRK